MPARNLLHKKDVDEFRRWLHANGKESRDSSAAWQVCQVRWGSGWMPLFSRAHMPEHVTVPDPLLHLVKQFLRAKHAAPQPTLEPNHALPQASPQVDSSPPWDCPT